MIGSSLRKFKKLSLENQVYALCLASMDAVSAVVILHFMEFAKGSPLSKEDISVITSFYEKYKNKVDWGKEKKNNPIIESLGISVQVVNEIIADALLKIINESKEDFPK